MSDSSPLPESKDDSLPDCQDGGALTLYVSGPILTDMGRFRPSSRGDFARNEFRAPVRASRLRRAQ